MEEAILNQQEVRDLMLTLLDAIEAIEEGQGRDCLPDELRDWALVLDSRLHEGGGTKDN